MLPPYEQRDRLPGSWQHLKSFANFVPPADTVFPGQVPAFGPGSQRDRVPGSWQHLKLFAHFVPIFDTVFPGHIPPMAWADKVGARISVAATATIKDHFLFIGISAEPTREGFTRFRDFNN